MIYYSKIIDADFEELTDEPLPEPKEKRAVEINKFYLAVNLILLSLIGRMLCTSFYWASLLR